MPRNYRKRSVGDIIGDGGELIERVNGRLWKIRCKCGNVFVAQPSDSFGRCVECGAKACGDSLRKHGESVHHGTQKATRLYNIWLTMRNRCYNPNSKSFTYYGGRGIYVCDQWNDYVAFKNWALSNGYNDNLSIDRIDVNGNYCPENCRWVTHREQMRNTRNNHLITYNGETKTMAEWSEIVGIKYHTLKRRLNAYGWSVERALSEVPKGGVTK